MTAADVVRNTLIAGFVAVLVGIAAAVVGLDPAHALALGCGVLAVVLVLLVQRSADPLVDAPPPEEDSDASPSAAGSSSVDRLAWSMVEHRTLVRGVVVARVRAVAAHRLAEHGLDPWRGADSPAVESLLGPAAWAVLRPDRDRPVTLRELDTALGALERLPAPEPFGPGTAPTDRTARAG